MSFKERFKGKMSNINKLGDIIDTNSNPGVKKIAPGLPPYIPKSLPAQPYNNAQIIYPPSYLNSPPNESYQYNYEISSQQISPKYQLNNQNMRLPLPDENIKNYLKPPLPASVKNNHFQEKPLLNNARLALESKHASIPDIYSIKNKQIQNSPKLQNGIDRKNFRNLAHQELSKNQVISPIKKVDDSDYSAYAISKDRLLDCSYQPYTLRDYKERYLKEYPMLGGLGANIGTEEWKEKKVKLDRMTEYSRKAHLTNKRRFISSAERMSMPDNRMMPKELHAALEKKKRMEEYSNSILRQLKEGGSIVKNNNNSKIPNTIDIEISKL